MQKSKDSLKACFENVNIRLYFQDPLINFIYVWHDGRYMSTVLQFLTWCDLAINKVFYYQEASMNFISVWHGGIYRSKV